MDSYKSKTIDYYNKHSQEFIDGTLNVEMTSIYSHFLPLLPKRATILDAGCGPGRDVLNFKIRGFDVEGFDPSSEMVKVASQYSGARISQADFITFTSDKQYDGIWACASLLHLNSKDLIEAIKTLKKLLKAEGLLYASFKRGGGEEVINGRFFNYQTEESLLALITEAQFDLIEMWNSIDVRNRDITWINVIAKKVKDDF
jgi:2-polyprenyl-3-methyl-5-hydroxy-6-metoxy-1,4-benzoquinol methylase